MLGERRGFSSRGFEPVWIFTHLRHLLWCTIISTPRRRLRSSIWPPRIRSCPHDQRKRESIIERLVGYRSSLDVSRRYHHGIAGRIRVNRFYRDSSCCRIRPRFEAHFRYSIPSGGNTLDGRKSIN